MAKGGVSVREIETARGIMAGKSVAAAMRDAGYSPKHADVNGGKVEARLREYGLLPTAEDAHDAVAILRKTIFKDDGRALADAYETHLALARAGDVKSLKLIMAYLVGNPASAVTVSGPGGGPVEQVTRVVFEWSDANDIPPDDTDAGDSDAD